jgi:hypothetical protein
MPRSNHLKKVADAEGGSARLPVNGYATRLSSATSADEVVGPIASEPDAPIPRHPLAGAEERDRTSSAGRATPRSDTTR